MAHYFCFVRDIVLHIQSSLRTEKIQPRSSMSRNLAKQSFEVLSILHWLLVNFDCSHLRNFEQKRRKKKSQTSIDDDKNTVICTWISHALG